MLDQKQRVETDILEQKLSQGSLPALHELFGLLGLARHFAGEATIVGADPIIRSPHHLGEAAGTAQLLIGMTAAAIWNYRTGASTDVAVDVIDALHSLHATHYVAQQGRLINVGAEHVDVNNVYQCRDGRYVMLEAGPPYKKLLKGYATFFDCGDSKESYAREVAKWDSYELEEALSAAGLPACRAFTRDEWLAHPQGQILSHVPVIEIEKIADGPPVPFGPSPSMPLSGLRVLDFTHVLAGPHSARTLAEFGAEVLHISAPDYPDTFAQHLGVDVGKFCAYLNLRDRTDLDQMLDLARTADVFTTSYRKSVNDKFGLTPETLAAESERGMVCLTINAYGHSGPWSERPGFDQNGQVATGFSVAEGGEGPPRFSPVFYLNDLMTGYFASAGMMAALLRRATEGGSYHVKVSLARTAMWVQDLGLIAPSKFQSLPAKDDYPVKLTTIDTVYGKLSQLRQPLTFSNLQVPETELLMPYGAADARWH